MTMEKSGQTKKPVSDRKGLLDFSLIIKYIGIKIVVNQLRHLII